MGELRNWLNATALGATLIFVATSGVVVWARGHAGKPDSYAAHREKAIVSQAAQDRFSVVMVGDSFVELADVPTLCGKRVLNAGVSGAKVADTARFAPQVMASERPDLVIVNVGVNDGHRAAMTPIDDMRRDIALIEVTARKFGARVFVLGIAPVSGAGISSEFDAGYVRKLDAVLRKAGGKSVPKLDSDDGLHPNAAGYVRWKSIMQGACA